MRHKKRILAAFLVLILALCTSFPALAADTSVADEPYVLDNGGFPKTVRAFLAQVPLERAQTAQVFSGEEECDDVAHVATGMTLKIYDFDQVVVADRPIVVMGDVTGSGAASLTQVTRIVQAFSGKEPLEGIYAQAADLSGNGAIDLTDVTIAVQEMLAVTTDPSHDMESRSLPLYIEKPDNKSEMNVYYFDGQDVPYVANEDMYTLLMAGMNDLDPNIKVDMLNDNGIITLMRDNGTVAEIDPSNDSITFTDMNWFYMPTFASTCMDILSISDFDTVEAHYIARTLGSFSRSGQPLYIPLDDYSIDAIRKDGTTYLPLQTVSDVLLAYTHFQVLYNGEMVALINYGDTDGFIDLYYNVPTGKRSPALAEFTYNEFCLACDLFYGLKEQHDIGSFADFFDEAGLTEDLKSEYPAIANQAVSEIMTGYLGDLHSEFIAPSPLTGLDVIIGGGAMSPALTAHASSQIIYRDARAAAYPDGVPAYQEVGDTAFVTIDSFTSLDDLDYYNTPPTAESADTVGIIMYAHSQIMRENSPIKNVVLDLSNCLGGEADSAIYTASWFLGGETCISMNDTLTGAQATTKYMIDANGDGGLGPDDTVTSKNLFCLISPVSFSCGNLVPACFKETTRVTLVGKRSAGGACVVQPLTLADGTLIQLSGSWRMSTMSNGSYYDIDKGIEPDLSLARPASFYDREKLASYLNEALR